MTDVSTATSFVDYARRAIALNERVERHAASECSPDINDTLATVTPPGTFGWMNCYAWAAPAPRADGALQMELSTGYDSVAGFYAAGKEVFNLKSFGNPMVKFTTPWFGLFESTGYMELHQKGDFDQDWVLFAPLDGPSGITGEIAWGKFPHRVPGALVTDNDRADRHAAFVEALRREDVDGVLATLSDDVVGAARNYTDDDALEFVAVNGAASVRAYYEGLFGAYQVLDVRPITVVMRGWYVFSELAWTVLRRDDPQRQSLSFLTGEIQVLDVDGRAWAKAGFGTPMEPLT